MFSQNEIFKRLKKQALKSYYEDKYLVIDKKTNEIFITTLSNIEKEKLTETDDYEYYEQKTKMKEFINNIKKIAGV